MKKMSKSMQEVWDEHNKYIDRLINKFNIKDKIKKTKKKDIFNYMLKKYGLNGYETILFLRFMGLRIDNKKDREILRFIKIDEYVENFKKKYKKDGYISYNLYTMPKYIEKEEFIGEYSLNDYNWN